MPEERPIKQYPRPLSPRLSIYRWHPEMMASLAHRASGMVLVLFVPFYLWLLQGMTGSPEDFEASLALLHTGVGRLMLWVVGASLIYHFCNGIRFICLDAGWGESRAAMRAGAQAMLAVAALAVIVLGIMLW